MLLVLLALNASYPRKKLIETLWPKEPNADEKDHEHNGLSQALTVLHKLLRDTPRKPVLLQKTELSLRLTFDDAQTQITTDWQILNELAKSNDVNELREAVRLHRPGGIGTGLITAIDQALIEGWRGKQKKILESILRKLNPREQRDAHIAEMAAKVMTQGGAKFLEELSLTPASQASFTSTGWEALGVTPAAAGRTLLPEHLPRAIDGRVDKSLAGAAQAQRTPGSTSPRDRFVIVDGPSKFGKTRALYDGVLRQAVLQEMATLAPRSNDPDDMANAVAVAGATSAFTLLWLDDIDGCCAFEFENTGVTAGRLRVALSQNPRLIILATAGGKGIERLNISQESERLGLPWQEIRELATLIRVDTEAPLRSDVQAAHQAGWPRELIALIRRYGLGPALSAGPTLVHHLETAHNTDRQGWALASAVGLLQQEDWFLGPVPEHVARGAWLGLIGQPPEGSRQDEAWASAREFATQEVRRAAHLIYRTSNGLELHDYVVPRLRLSREQRRRALIAAVEMTTLPECRSVLSQRTGISVESLAAALRLVREGDDDAIKFICDLLTERLDWPTDNQTIEASERFATWVAQKWIAAINTDTIANMVIIESLHHLAGLPDPIFCGMCKRIEGSSTVNADIAISALRLARTRADSGGDDRARLLTAASATSASRRLAARKLLEVLSYRVLPDLPDVVYESFERETDPYFTSLMIVAATDEIEADSAYRSLAEIVVELGVIPVAQALAQVTDSATSACRTADAFDQLIPGHFDEWPPQVAIARASIAAWHDPRDSELRTVLRRLVTDPDEDIARGAGQVLVRTYYCSEDYCGLYSVLDALPNAVALNYSYWQRPLHPEQNSWLIGRAQDGDLEAAAMICLQSEDQAARAKALAILRRALSFADPQRIGAIAYMLCGGLGTGEIYPETLHFGVKLLRELRAYPLAHFVRTMAASHIANGPDGASEVAEILEDSIRDGDIHVVDMVRNLEDKLGSEQSAYLLAEWESFWSQALTPLWEWALTLP